MFSDRMRSVRNDTFSLRMEGQSRRIASTCSIHLNSPLSAVSPSHEFHRIDSRDEFHRGQAIPVLQFVGLQEAEQLASLIPALEEERGKPGIAVALPLLD